MDVSLLGFAVAAGLVAAVNPCGFAMLPAYLALVVLGEESQESQESEERRGRAAVVGRALVATALMALGFLLVFGTFGAVIAPLASSVQQYLPAVTVVIGAVMVAAGVWLLLGRELTIVLPRSARGAPTRRLGSMVGYGVAYAVASLSCTIGPFLAVTSATFGTGSVWGGVVGFLAYGLGMALTVGVLAVSVALAGNAVTTRARRLLPYVNRASGALLVLVGLYVGYYGVYELRLFFGGADAQDPVVDAAGSVQQFLAGWVDAAGATTIAVVLVVVVVGALVVHRRRRPTPDRTIADARTGGTRPPAREEDPDR